jgi:hypothetical protein
MIQNIKKSKKGISQTLSIIILTLITIAGATIVYVYIMGYNTTTSVKPLETIQIENIVWTSPNELTISILNIGSMNKVIDTVYVSGLRGFPSSYVELEPGARKDVKFFMENNIIPGEHTVKVVCKDGTIGVIAHRFIAPIETIITTTTTVTTITTTPTTTTTGCLIVSAAYGSNLAPTVKFIQNFRDNVVAKTFIGSAFIEAFNRFYYSWSPSVARVIAIDPLIRDLTRITIYPLISATLISFMIESALSFNQEFAVAIAIIVGGFLFGLFYFTPIYLIAKRKISIKNLNKAISFLMKPFFLFLFFLYIGVLLEFYMLTLYSIVLTFLTSIMLGIFIGIYSLEHFKILLKPRNSHA